MFNQALTEVPLGCAQSEYEAITFSQTVIALSLITATSTLVSFVTYSNLLPRASEGYGKVMFSFAYVCSQFKNSFDIPGCNGIGPLPQHIKDQSKDEPNPAPYYQLNIY